MKHWLLLLFVLILLISVYRDWKQAQLNRDLVMAVGGQRLEEAQAALQNGAYPGSWLCDLQPETAWPFQRVKPLLRVLLRMRGVQGHNTPVLIFAATSDQPAMVRLLLEHGADSNIRGNLGDTPLMHAAGFSDASCVQLLLDYKADVHARNILNNTAYDCAVEQGRRRIPNLEVLKKAGA